MTTIHSAAELPTNDVSFRKLTYIKSFRAVFDRVTPPTSILTLLFMLVTSSAAVAQPFFFNFEEKETGDVLAFMELSNLPVDTLADIRSITFVDPMDADYSLEIRIGGSFLGGVIASDGANGLGGPGFLSLDFFHGTPTWLTENEIAAFNFRFDDGDGTDRISVPGFNDDFDLILPPSFFVDGNWIGVTDIPISEPLVCSPTNSLQGDLNGDGSVDFPDFLLLSANFGNEVESYGDGDITCDGTVGFDDFLALSANFGQSLSGQSEAQTAAFVPEPSAATCAFIAFGCLVAIARRRGYFGPS